MPQDTTLSFEDCLKLAAGSGIGLANAQNLKDAFDAALSALQPGVAASGTITCVATASIADTDYLTIGDGLSAPKLYELDKAGDGVTVGRIQVDVSGDTTAAEVAARLKTAIEANQPALSVTRDTGVLTITHKIPGVVGNVTITENVANAGFTVTGLSGGTDAA